MELWDVYDENRKMTGKTHERGVPLGPGEYHIIADVWTVNQRSEILLTRRHPDKPYGLLWECTGGSVLTGENSVEGALHPSSDAKTHLELYRAFPEIGGVVHTHSVHAVAWAQAGRDIPCYGTTHADYFYGPVPCARSLTGAEVEEDYEKNTGTVIVETFRARDIDPVHVPGVICRSHGPFAWGKDAAQAVYHAAVLEEVAKMALLTVQIDPGAAPAPQYVQDKHFLRKHGPGAYYGQARG